METVKPDGAPRIVNGLDTKLVSKPIVNRLAYGIMYVFLVLVAVFQIFPIIWLFLFSLKSNQEVFNMSPFSLPENPKWENYAKVWTEGNISLYFIKCNVHPCSCHSDYCFSQHGYLCHYENALERQQAGAGTVYGRFNDTGPFNIDPFIQHFYQYQSD